MIFGIYELLGRLCVEDPTSKLLVLDQVLRTEARRIVVAANAALNRDVDELGGRKELYVHRAFVLDEPIQTDVELIDSVDKDRPLLTSGNLAVLLPINQGNLVNFRDGSICITFRVPDDGSNDENSFPVWLDNELPGSRSATFELISKVFLKGLSESFGEVGFEQEFNDATRRVVSAIEYVAEAYRKLGRTERGSTGSLWLQHLDMSFRRFSELVDKSGSREVADVARFVEDFFYPAVSLPNPKNGVSYQIHQRVGAAKSVAEAIEKFWSESDGTNRIIDSLSAIDESRLTLAKHENCKLNSLNWNSIRKTWIARGFSSNFLSWHLHEEMSDGYLPDVDRLSAFRDLTEEEFFAPLPLSPPPIDGEWCDGRPLRFEDIETEVVVLSPVFFDSNSRELSSVPLQLNIFPIPGQRLSKDELEEVIVIPKQARNGVLSLSFEVKERRFDEDLATVSLIGVFVRTIATQSSFSHNPQVQTFRTQGPKVMSGQEMKVLLLPATGSGFLLGKNLKYYGPKRFDKEGMPIWDSDDLDPDTESIEFPLERSAGDQLSVLGWSSLLPDLVRLDNSEASPWIDRGFLRHQWNFSARPSEQNVDIYWGDQDARS
jgi:hypothetical protein